jgi:hypothetical protein
MNNYGGRFSLTENRTDLMAEDIAIKIDNAFKVNTGSHPSHGTEGLRWRTLSLADALKHRLEWDQLFIQPSGTVYTPWRVNVIAYFYSLQKMDYLLGIITAVVMAFIMLGICWQLLKRIFEIVILMLLAAPMISIAPLDGGNASKKWQAEFIKRVVAIIGPVFAINMYFVMVPLFLNLNFFGNLGAAAATAPLAAEGTVALGTGMFAGIGIGQSNMIFLAAAKIYLLVNAMVQLLVCLVGLEIVKSASGLLSNLLGVEDLAKGSVEVGQKAVKAGAMAAGGGAMKAAGALAGKAAAGKAAAGGAGKGAAGAGGGPSMPDMGGGGGGAAPDIGGGGAKMASTSPAASGDASSIMKGKEGLPGAPQSPSGRVTDVDLKRINLDELKSGKGKSPKEIVEARENLRTREATESSHKQLMKSSSPKSLNKLDTIDEKASNKIAKTQAKYGEGAANKADAKATRKAENRASKEQDKIRKGLEKDALKDGQTAEEAGANIMKVHAHDANKAQIVKDAGVKAGTDAGSRVAEKGWAKEAKIKQKAEAAKDKVGKPSMLAKAGGTVWKGASKVGGAIMKGTQAVGRGASAAWKNAKRLYEESGVKDIVNDMAQETATGKNIRKLRDGYEKGYDKGLGSRGSGGHTKKEIADAIKAENLKIHAQQMAAGGAGAPGRGQGTGAPAGRGTLPGAAAGAAAGIRAPGQTDKVKIENLSQLATRIAETLARRGLKIPDLQRAIDRLRSESISASRAQLRSLNSMLEAGNFKGLEEAINKLASKK